ncbi:MAG: hypothetical protein KUG77_09360 [Nannocystaceae bacterium]|nr:hypothetical protein [Nannocystaceae bacterium]
MATKSEAWEPEGGWERFSRADDVEELAWEVLAGWHFINPTASTSVWESPQGATVYLAFDHAHALIEVMVGRSAEEEPDLEEFATRLAKYGLRPVA